MKKITKETRFDSFLQTEPSKRCKAILSVMTEPMTARQIARKLGYSDLNAVRPRLTEMVDEGRVEVIGKAYDATSERKVALYQKVAECNVED